MEITGEKRVYIPEKGKSSDSDYSQLRFLYINSDLIVINTLYGDNMSFRFKTALDLLPPEKRSEIELSNTSGYPLKEYARKTCLEE